MGRLTILSGATVLLLAFLSAANGATFTPIVGGPYTTCALDVAGTFLDTANITTLTVPLFRTDIEALSKTYTRTDQICLCQRRLQLAAIATLAGDNASVLYGPFVSLGDWNTTLLTFFYSIFIGLIVLLVIDLITRLALSRDLSMDMMMIGRSSADAQTTLKSIEAVEAAELTNKRTYLCYQGFFMALYGVIMVIVIISLNAQLNTNTWKNWNFYGIALVSIPFTLVSQGILKWLVSSDYTAAKLAQDDRRTIETLYIRWSQFNWFLIGLALFILNDTWTGLTQVWFGMGALFFVFAPWLFLMLTAFSNCCCRQQPAMNLAQGKEVARQETPQEIAFRKTAENHFLSLRSLEALTQPVMLILGSVFVVVGAASISQAPTLVACGWFLYGDYADNFVIVPLTLFCISIGSAILLFLLWAYIVCIDGGRLEHWQNARHGYSLPQLTTVPSAAYDSRTLEIQQSAAAAGQRNKAQAQAAYF